MYVFIRIVRLFVYDFVSAWYPLAVMFFLLSNFLATTSKPNCWAVLPQGNQVSVVVAVLDRLYHLDPYEAVPQVRLKTIQCIFVAV